MKSLLIALAKSVSTYLIIAATIVIVVSLKSMGLTYSNFTLTTPSGKTSETIFPFFVQSNETGVYTLHGNAEMSERSSTIVRIIPDDEILSLTVNDIYVNLQMIPYDQRRDYTKGFIYDLKPYLHVGKNKIDITYVDNGGLMGIIMSSVPSERYVNFMYALCTFMVLLIFVQILKRTSLSKSIQVLLVGALLIRIIYFMVTPPDVRGHDVGAHMAYVDHLVAHWVPPPVEQAAGGAFFHPPLYYYTAAVVYKISQIFEPSNKYILYRIQQLFSLVYSMGFLLFGLLILDRVLKTYRDEKFVESTDNVEPAENTITPTWRSPSYWCTAYKNNGLFWIIGALFVFWPVNVIHSIRIGNDQILYFFLTASLYYLYRWYQEDKKRDLMIASILAALSIVSKANGEILIAVIGLIGLYKMIKTREWKTYFKLAIVPCLILFIAFMITIMPGLILKLQGKRNYLYFQDLSGVSTANLVGNTAANILWFDAKTFVTEPFTDPYDDRYGRQYFWNYLGKTGIIGEFRYDSKLCINMSIICSFFAMWMMLYVLVGLYYMTRENLMRQAPIFLAGFFLWASVTYMRVTFPVNIDFRYITPALVSFCALYAASIITFNERGSTRLANIGLAMSIAFTLSGITFIFGLL